MSVRGYTPAASWSRGGDFSGALEDLSSLLDSEEDMVASWGRQEPRSTTDAVGGKLTFTVLNHGRQFSPENTASVIAGKQTTGTPVRLTKVDPASSITYNLFQGPIDGIKVSSDVGDQKVRYTISDGWGKPGDTKLSTSVHSGQRTGEIISDILDMINWTGGRDLDPGVTVPTYWWEEGTDASTAINKLVHSDGPPALAWVQNGTFFFRDRHHRVTEANALTSQGTYTHIVPAGPIGTDLKILKGSFSYDHGLDYVVNSATLEVTPRVPGGIEVVWHTDDPIIMDANEQISLVIQTEDPFLNLQLPTTGIYLNDGTFTQDYVLASGSVSFGLSRTSGQSAFLTITAGAGGAYLVDGLRVRGAVLRAGNVRIATAADPTSAGQYGEKDWDGEAPWANYYDAQAIVDRVVSVYAQPRPSVTFDVEGRLSAATLTRILGTALSDRITVRNDEIGLNTDFHVEQITHTIKQLGARHIMTIGAQVVEPYQASNPFTFDVAGKGFDQGQFAMDTGNNPANMFRFDTPGHGFNQGVFAS